MRDTHTSSIKNLEKIPGLYVSTAYSSWLFTHLHHFNIVDILLSLLLTLLLDQYVFCD